MKRNVLAILALMIIGANVQAQQQAPQILIRAAHCLAVKGFLQSSGAGTLSLGYLLDEQSYPGDKVAYVVAFAAPSRSNGKVFTVFLSSKSGHEILDIQNNASFVLSKRDSLGVSFVNPPLGGTWTQEHLVSAIKTIEKQPRFTISTKDILTTDSPVGCEAYTDPQPKPNSK
jgi:hypothetical protein